MSAPSGRTWRDAFAHFDPDGCCWRTSQLSLPLESSNESPTPWPRSGIASRGSAFPLPPWERRINASGSSSSLLPTPRTSDTNGAGQPAVAVLDLRTAVNLLPTPRASDGEKGGPNQRGSSGDLMLPSAVMRLLPTPTTTNANGNQYNNAGKRLLPGIAVDLTGPATPPPSIDGKPSSDDPHPPLPLWAPAAETP